MILKILTRYGAPPQLYLVIRRMYQDLKVVLKIGKVKESMSQTAGVRKGDCMSPVLFLFVVMAFAELLEKEWSKSGLDMIEMLQHTHSPRDFGQPTNHKNNKLSEGNLLSLFLNFVRWQRYFHIRNKRTTENKPKLDILPI